MSPISITFRTPTNPEFKWFDSFEDLTDEELEEIAVQCRSATAAFFTELSHRRTPRKDWTVESHLDMLLENANRINRKGFTDEHKVRLNNLYTFLADPVGAQPERDDNKVARQYLWLVSRVTDWSYALLILCALGKDKLHRLNEDQRIKLIKYIAQHPDSLFCPKLKDKAIQCNLFQICMRPTIFIVLSIKLSQVSNLNLH